MHFFPNNPFHAGRLIDIQTSFGSLDLEWAQGRPRRAILRATTTGEVCLRLSSDLKRFRVGKRMQDVDVSLRLNRSAKRGVVSRQYHPPLCRSIYRRFGADQRPTFEPRGVYSGSTNLKLQMFLELLFHSFFCRGQNRFELPLSS